MSAALSLGKTCLADLHLQVLSRFHQVSTMFGHRAPPARGPLCIFNRNQSSFYYPERSHQPQKYEATLSCPYEFSVPGESLRIRTWTGKRCHCKGVLGRPICAQFKTQVMHQSFQGCTCSTSHTFFRRLFAAYSDLASCSVCKSVSFVSMIYQK